MTSSSPLRGLPARPRAAGASLLRILFWDSDVHSFLRIPQVAQTERLPVSPKSPGIWTQTKFAWGQCSVENLHLPSGRCLRKGLCPQPGPPEPGICTRPELGQHRSSRHQEPEAGASIQMQTPGGAYAKRTVGGWTGCNFAGSQRELGPSCPDAACRRPPREAEVGNLAWRLRAKPGSRRACPIAAPLDVGTELQVQKRGLKRGAAAGGRGGGAETPWPARSWAEPLLPPAS
ncbi:unnamed protein product [Rangifer tarandus platyrhynchus]|uniref:Uncharacterized protein n=2 Tax=Rangifer tarandus platyrhynchus TaxID=3082113 RepID=A0ACB0DV77_RANTA|nr:unnamed protein product [Rangifer tarandus platyrhynchus]CAI9692227.1 unnamed protein product [Rangifer tarandus platyrhynchus]